MKSVEKPTRVRWRVISVTTLMSLLLYLDRFSISTAEIYIKEDLSLTRTQIGMVISGFFWAYALAQVGTGWLADRFGARTMLTFYILAWSLCTGLVGTATGFLSLFAWRVGMGIAQAGAYPAGAGVVRNWMPLSRRGTGSSIVTFGGRVGGTLALFLTGYVILLFVPVTVSSRIRDKDVMDAGRLCLEIQRGKEESSADDPATRIGERLRERLSSESSSFVARAAHEATEYKSQLEIADRQGLLAPNPPNAKLMTDSSFIRLLSDLNLALADPDLFSDMTFANLPVEMEGRRLLKRPATDLSPADTERLNRLVLEAAYRESIGKVYVAGWRKTMFVYGGMGILVAAIFWMVHRDRAELHPGCNEAERQLIGTAIRPTATISNRLPLATLLSNGSMWLNCLMQFTTNVGWVFLVTLTPRYFAEKHNVPLELRGWMVAIPTLVGCFGMLLGGWLTDRLTAKIGLRWGRTLPIIATRLVAAMAYLGCLLQPNPWVAVIAFSVVAFCVDLAIGAVWAYQQDVGGRFVGSVLGWGNMWGNFGAAVAPVLVLRLMEKSQNWDIAFVCGATAFIISGVAALGIDATKPIYAEVPASGADVGR